MTVASRAVRASALVALVLAAVWMFWPTRLGGDTVYVTTHGISMQPRFHTGDLAILRAATHYSVGDVVAYSSDTLKTTVMHRIVAMDGDRFVFKGDNNSWLDPDHPSENQLLGALWLRIPRGGKVLSLMESPLVMVLLSLAGSIFLGATSRPARRLRGRRRQRPTRATRRPSLPVRALARQAVLVSAGVAVVAVAGGAALLAPPDTQTDEQTVQVSQAGQFAYLGTAARGTTYPTGRIQTGDPVYTQLARSITVTFRDRVTGPGLTGLRGTIRLVVTITTADGWTGTLTSGATSALDDDSLAAQVLLDPAYATDVMNRHDSEVGAPGGSATLTVVPRVTLRGAVQGHSFVAASPAGFSFALTPTMLRPSSSGTAAFAPAVSTGVETTSVVPRRFELLSVSIPIGLARILDGVVLALALVVLATSAWIGRKGSRDAVDDILLRSAARILPVTRFTPGASVVDVSDAASLRRVAERLDSLMLHQIGEDGHTFAVQDVETTYRYVLPNATMSPPPPPAPITRPLPRVPAVVLKPVPEDGPTGKHAAPTGRPAVPAPRPATAALPPRRRARPPHDPPEIGDLGAMFG
jgi:signal peptidase I